MRYIKLWAALITVIVGSLAVLGYYGWQIYQTAPPIPTRVLTSDGTVIFQVSRFVASSATPFSRPEPWHLAGSCSGWSLDHAGTVLSESLRDSTA